METQERVRSRASRALGRKNGSRRNGAKAAKSDTDIDLKKLLRALQAVRDGDFSVRLPSDRTGIGGKIADTFNEIIASNQRVAREVERAGQMVGKEGKTRHRITVDRRSGAWGAMESSMNMLIDDLLWPTTEVTRAISAVAKGDLSQTVPLEVEGRPLRGEFLRSATIVNAMIEQMSAFTSEVTRVAREVGTEGKLGGQADLKNVSGIWKDLTDNVNSMASNLTGQVRNISEVTIAVANGDLSRKITVDVRGEILQLKEAINTMVDQLRSFASEVTRVAREVGTEGKLGGQAIVPGVAGTWKDLTDNVNSMASNLTGQVRNIAEVSTAIARGDLSRKITVDVKGEILELKNTINTMVDQLNCFASEVTRVAREVGTEGKLGGQANVPGVGGTWKDLTDNVNSMASNLTGQVRNIADVATAIAGGDLSRKITVDVRGEILQLKETINTMVDQLRAFASEVTRVAREVGTEGKLGGQANVPGVGGTWKDLTDNVNSMASNLTGQVRNIAEVSTAIARGDLSRKITVDVKGEILQLKEAVNTMVDQLNAFAAEVTRVAREVGTEGKLGGQADVKGVSGVWKDLTDNVNSMAVEPHGPGPQHRGRRHRHRERRPVAQDHGRRARRNPPAERNDQHARRPAQRVRGRSDARGARSRHRRQARRSGGSERRQRCVERPHRQRQLHGLEPHRPGAQHRRSGHGHRARRPVSQDHGRRARRDPAAEGNHEHDGRPAQQLRGRSDARGARGRHRRQARRPGDRAGRRRHLERPHRQRQLDGLEPHGPGPQHRRSVDGHRARRPVAQDHGRREGRNPAAERDHQHDGRPAQRLRGRSDARGARSRHRRQARRPGAGARRRRHVEGSHRQRQHDGEQPHEPGARHREGRDRGRQRRAAPAPDGGIEGRSGGARRHDQQHDRHARRRSPTR